MTKKKYLYKFLRTGMKSNSGDHTWEIGKWYKYNGKISICNAGFHASKEIGQAFSYVSGEILAKVEVRGEHEEEPGKEVWSEMRVVKAWNWTKNDSVEIAIFAAEQVIEVFEKKYPNDDRPRKAIEAAKAWSKDPSDKNKKAARTAAYEAYAAAYAARTAADAAYTANAVDAADAAAYAAYTAAYEAYTAADAAYAAAYAARTAAYAAMVKKIYARFDKQLKKLTEYDNKAK